MKIFTGKLRLGNGNVTEAEISEFIVREMMYMLMNRLKVIFIYCQHEIIYNGDKQRNCHRFSTTIFHSYVGALGRLQIQRRVVNARIMFDV